MSKKTEIPAEPKPRELITISDYCIRKNVDFSTVSRKVKSGTINSYTSRSALKLIDWNESKDYAFRRYTRKYTEEEWQDIKKEVANKVGKTMREKSNAHYGKKKYARYE